MNQQTWDQRMLQLAEHVSTWSKDPSTKVGAVITRPDHTIASVGFNGFPRGVHDTDERLENRSTKYNLVVHAEINAILHAHEPVNGYTLYVHPLFPCANCAGAIIQSGISTVVWADVPITFDRWDNDHVHAATMFYEAGITNRAVAPWTSTGTD
jgi:dCMP deaminase